MRWAVCALFVLALPASAIAGDYGVLPNIQTVGPANFYNWTGLYVGGQFGYGNTNADFSKATEPLIAFSLRELALENEVAPSTWPVLGKSGSDATGYGGFIGYNTQWQDLVLGVEGNYTHTNFSIFAPATPISRLTSAGGNTYSVTVNASGDLDLTDYGSLRLRAGYILGRFMPYGFAGVAIGSGNYSLNTLVYGQENPSSPPVVPCNTMIAPSCVDYAFPNSDTKNGALLYGFTVGGGLEVALTHNVFLRGEFEYLQFAPVANILVTSATARVGAGLKF